MRNLKRVLSLALAAMMLIGMMVVGASAANASDFTDYDEVQHKEAVSTMVALNVIDGKEDGSYFAPSDTLTREEMSKIIAYVVNGGVEPVVGVKPVPTYADIDDNWAEKYIEYCTSAGIIAGDGTGNFNPKGTLTGEQAAKMLLTAMGYNAEVFGFVGNNWAINVNRYANEAGLYKDLADIDPSEPISRDDAMQLAYNAIQAPLMIRSWNQNQVTGEVTEIYTTAVNDQGRTLNSLLIDKFDGTIELGYMTDFTYDEVKGLWTYDFASDPAAGIFFNGAGIPENKGITDDAVSLTSDVDYTALYGMQVKVIYNTEDHDVVYGVFNNDSSVMVSGASGDVISVDVLANTVKIGGTNYKVDATNIPVFNFGANNGRVGDADLTDLVNNITGYTFNLVDNDGDSKGDAVIRVPNIAVGEISHIGTNTMNVSGQPQYSIDDVALYEDAAIGDWVYVIPAANSNTEKLTLVKAELQTSTVEAVRGGDNDTTYTEYKLSGQWYYDSNLIAVADVNVNDTVEYVTLGSTVFYMDIQELAATTKNLVMVISADTVDSQSDNDNLGAVDVKAKLLFADGSSSTVVIDKVNSVDAVFGGDTAGDVENLVGRLATYRTNSSGNYELTAVNNNNLAGYKEYMAGGDNDFYDDGEVLGEELANDAVVFVLQGNVGAAANTNKGSVYTGKEIKNQYGNNPFGDNAQILTKVSDGFTYAQVVLLTTGTLPTITSGSNYGYLTANTSRIVDSATDKTYLQFTYQTANGEETAIFESLDDPSEYPRGAVITYDDKADGDPKEIKNVSIVPVATGIVTGWDGKEKIQIAGLGNSVVDADETMVIYVDSKEMVGAETGIIQIGADTVGNDKIADQPNVLYYGNNTQLGLLVVDVNNHMQPGPVISFDAYSVTDIQNALSTNNTTTANIGGLKSTGAVTVGDAQTLYLVGSMPAGYTLTINAEAGSEVYLNDVELTGDVITVPARALAVNITMTLAGTDDGMAFGVTNVHGNTVNVDGDELIGANVSVVTAGDGITMDVTTTGTLKVDADAEGTVKLNGTTMNGDDAAVSGEGVETEVKGNTISVTKGEATVDAGSLGNGTIIEVAAGATANVSTEGMTEGTSVVFKAPAAGEGDENDGVVTIDEVDYFKMLPGAESLTVSADADGNVTIEVAGNVDASSIEATKHELVFTDKVTAPDTAAQTRAADVGALSVTADAGVVFAGGVDCSELNIVKGTVALGGTNAFPVSMTAGTLNVTGILDASLGLDGAEGTVNVTGTLKIDANTDDETGKLPTVGTLTVAADGTLKSMTTSGDPTETIFVGPTANARIQTGDKTTVDIKFVESGSHGAENRHEMTITGDATIPTGKIWYAMFDSSIKDDEGDEVSKAQGIDMTLASGTLTVNGTLNLSSASKTGSSLIVDADAEVIVNGTVKVANYSDLTVDKGASFTGGSEGELNVAAGDGGVRVGTISGVAGVENKGTVSYTWDATGEKWVSSTAADEQA